MFFEGDRIIAMREMILADDGGRAQRRSTSCCRTSASDFVGIFTAMKGLPVTIRLLDPPLHEFLPHEPRRRRSSRKTRASPSRIAAPRRALHELNPMLGHRGCRLGITYPEISEMQARAIFEAALDVPKKGIEVQPEIMIPLVGTRRARDPARHRAEVADEVEGEGHGSSTTSSAR